MGREVGISPGQIPSPTPFLTRLVNMKMIIVVMMRVCIMVKMAEMATIVTAWLKGSVHKLLNRGNDCLLSF